MTGDPASASAIPTCTHEAAEIHVKNYVLGTWDVKYTKAETMREPGRCGPEGMHWQGRTGHENG